MTDFKTLICLFLALFMVSCHSGKQDKLTIAAAANMQYAMEDITTAFEQETGISCQVILGSSGKITAQITAGAPYQVFVSADTAYPRQLYREGLAAQEPGIYAFGKLVLWTMESGLSIENSHEFLSKAGEEVRHLALANPRTAPYGSAALEVLQNLNCLASWESRLVYGESIGQVNQFVSTGAADVGITAKAVVMAKPEGKWAALDEHLYSPIAQGVVLLKADEGDAAQAQKFYDFLFSDRVKKILDKFGYASPAQ